MTSLPSPSPSGSRPSLRLLAGMITFIAVTSGAGIALLGHPTGAVAEVAGPDTPPAAPVGAQAKVATEATEAPAANTSTVAAAAADAGAPPAEADTHSPAANVNQESPTDPAAMVAQLQARMDKTPDDAEGWQMLGRSYTVMDRPADAVKAYRQLLRLRPDDSQAMSDLGRAIGSANGRKLNEEAESLLNKAIQKDKTNVMAHALLGKTEMDRGQPAKAREHWVAALDHLDPKHPFAEQLRNAIQMTGQQPGSPTPPAATTSTNPAPSATVKP
ncbi:MAG: tetratricopeptide repeat protein [Pseudomonadota bacterium]